VPARSSSAEPRSPDPGRRRTRRRPWENLSAPQLFVLSFLILIATGTLGFLVLPGLYTGEPLGVIDALFTATSAVCVTGLSVVDVSKSLTVWGQAWLLLLIQAGGLGILTFSAVFTSIVGRRSRLTVEEAASDVTSVLPSVAPVRLLYTALGVTLAVEAAGAALLWLAWWEDFGAGRALWLAVFHAVSAFCNAGFSLFSDNLVGFQRHAGPLLAVGALIVVGGLGFPVIQDLRLRLRRRGRHRRLTLHTRVVLFTSAALLAISMALYLLFESGRTLRELGAGHRVLNAFFLAVTPRTAGFNTVDYDQLSNPGIFLTLGLMWVGGGPFSTAGGVKVTTAALLILLLFTRLRGDRHVSLAGRTIPDETTQRAAGLAAGAFLLLAGFVFLLLMTEDPAAGAAGERSQFVRVVFEVQSAFSTVGLSMNLTSQISPPGRAILSLVMLLGRVGPLAVLGAMALRQRARVPFRYAHEEVLVG
jgi:trk system potassium uptake protein TrkH